MARIDARLVGGAGAAFYVERATLRIRMTETSGHSNSEFVWSLGGRLEQKIEFLYPFFVAKVET